MVFSGFVVQIERLESFFLVFDDYSGDVCLMKCYLGKILFVIGLNIDNDGDDMFLLNMRLEYILFGLFFYIMKCEINVVNIVFEVVFFGLFFYI